MRVLRREKKNIIICILFYSRSRQTLCDIVCRGEIINGVDHVVITLRGIADEFKNTKLKTNEKFPPPPGEGRINKRTARPNK